MAETYGGFLGGMADAVNSYVKKKQDQQIAQKKDVADAFLHQLQNDDTQTMEDKVNTFRNYLKASGVPDKHAKTLVEHSQYWINLLKNQNEATQNPPLPGETAAAPERTVTPPIVNLPGGGKEQGAASTVPAVAAGPAAPLPTYQSPTMADYKAKAEGTMTSAKYKAMQDAIASGKVQVAGATGNTVEGKTTVQAAKSSAEAKRAIDIANANRAAGMQMYKDLSGQSGHMKPGLNGKGEMSLTPDSGQFLQGLYRGDEVPTAKGPNGETLDPNQVHHLIKYFNGDIVGIPTENTNVTATLEPDGKGGVVRVYRDKTTGQEVQDVEGHVNRVPSYDPRIMPLIRTHEAPVTVNVGGVPTVITQQFSATSQRQIPNTPNPLPPGATQAAGQSQTPAAPVGAAAGAPAGAPGPGPASPVSAMPAKPPAMPVRPAPQASANPANPTSPLPPGARVIGVKPLPAKQVLDNSTKLDLINTTIGRFKFLEDNANMFASPTFRAKIHFETSPQGLVTALANAGMSLSPKEADVAAAFNKLSEDIFLSKGALGAGSMPRSEKAMDIVELQKGSMSQNPEVIRRTWKLSEQELRNIRDPLVQQAKQYGYGKPEDLGEPPTMTGYGSTILPDGKGAKVTADVVKQAMAANNNDKAAARKALEAAHWDTK